MVYSLYLTLLFHYKVAVDTGSYKLWVFDEDCGDCGDHIQYKPSDSDTYEKVDDEFEITYGQGHVKGKSVKDTVYLTADMEVKGQIFGAVDKVDGIKLPCDGIIGKWKCAKVITFATH